MIKYLKEEPALKKIFVILVCSTIILTVIIFLTHIIMLQSIYTQHDNLNKELIGSLAKKYPEDETEIVRMVTNVNDNQNLKYGSKILEKYGYDNTAKAWNDKTFSKNIINIAAYDFICFTIILFIIIILFRFCSLYFIKKLKKLSNVLDDINNGSYLVNIESNEEGILSRIGTKVYQISRRVHNNLSKLDREKENIKSLVTDISHQIKTPLSAIKLYNSILMEDNDISENERNEFLSTINNEVMKLQWLTDSLIKVSRLETGMIEIKKSKNSIKKTICEAVESVYIKAMHKNIEIDVKPFEECIIFYDDRWTKEAIVNVLENAVKYTGEDGKISINIENMSLYIKIDIEDNGIGIPREEFNDIFKRFYRGNSEIVQKAEGSGVGLYLTRKILEEQGGNIVVDSKLGAGTKFSLFLQKCK